MGFHVHIATGNNEKEVTSRTEEIFLCGQVWRLFGLPSASLPQFQLHVQLAQQVLQWPSTVIAHVLIAALWID